MPCRRAVRVLLVFGLVALASVPAALGQQGALDKVHYRDAEGKLVSVDGEIKETPAGVQFTSGTKALISPVDIVRIDYGNPKGVNKADQFAAIALEDGGDPAKARQAYSDLLKKAGADAPAQTKRYLSFREAIWAGRAASAKTGDEFKADAAKAVEMLTAVARASETSWEVWPTSRAAARLATELGDHAKAAGLLGQLAAVKGLPPALKLEAQLAQAAALLRDGKATAVEPILAQVEKDKDFPKAGALPDRLAVLRAAVKKDATPAAIEEATAKVKDPVAKAVGANLLGDAQLAARQPREAMWAYLWADVVYNQDRGEQVYAVSQLVGVFEALGDKDRAKQYRDRLPQVR